MNDEELLFPSYNAMSRPATFLGVPILPFVGIAVALLVVGTVGFLLFPWWGALLLASPLFLALVGFSVVSSFDARYMRRIVYAMRRFSLNLRYGRGVCLTPINPLWSVFYGKRFAQRRHAGGSFGSADEISRA
ncbi:conjugal transfer protein [Pseudomonas aeruginosa]|uniref:VirB3 family type IV secretion system protein n=1 Tax=Pseudomonas aeruginosa TaxID=287 RepID=UPI000BC7B226|nr:VirB3 family type IV secretion system protein [Pseudomonas aeruginosa]PCM96093.1 conjugal transfer protein [Pseudomonas aeruginosa]PCN09111.1 conjugal transfer protein [Pseudomonas aeruginosa]